VQDTERYWTQAPPPPPPQESVSPQLAQALRTMYKDAPPDVQREVEAVFGLEPSRLPPVEEEGGNDKTDYAEAARTAAQHQHEIQMQHLKDQGAARLQVLKMVGDAVNAGREARQKKKEAAAKKK